MEYDPFESVSIFRVIRPLAELGCSAGGLFFAKIGYSACNWTVEFAVRCRRNAVVCRKYFSKIVGVIKAALISYFRNPAVAVFQEIGSVPQTHILQKSYGTHTGTAFEAACVIAC